MSQLTESLARYDAVFSSRAVEPDANGLYKFRMTTEVVDSHDSILRVAGCDLTRFRMNPVVVIDDENSVTAICGKAETIDIVADPVPSIDLGIRFAESADAPNDPGSLCARLARGGFLRGMSHFFAPIEIREGSQISEAERVLYGLSRYGYIIERWELRAASMVAVGSNPKALKRAVSDGTITDSDAKRVMQITLPRITKRAEGGIDTMPIAQPQQTPSVSDMLAALGMDVSSLMTRMDELHAYMGQVLDSQAVVAALVRIEELIRALSAPRSVQTDDALARLCGMLDRFANPGAVDGAANRKEGRTVSGGSA